jgi:predicted O-methyltransferase YrrM
LWARWTRARWHRYVFSGQTAWKEEPDDSIPPQDLRLLRQTFDIDGVLAAKDGYVAEDADAYYARTTDRDYRALELCVGPGMHTELCAPFPVLRFGGHTRQAALVLMEAAGAKNVLEVGCGRGYCTLFLAGLLPRGTGLHAVDRVQRHIQLAQDACAKGGYGHVHFTHADGTEFLQNAASPSYDLIFGVESLCHLDTSAKLHAFVAQASARLASPGGKLVVVDGFRASSWTGAPEPQRTAMRLAECGFRIRRMPSKAEWTEAAAGAGLQLTRNVDLTAEALPFWTLGWRLARTLLRLLPGVVVRRAQDNLLAVATTAHAMRSGAAAEYGVLVFQKP